MIEATRTRVVVELNQRNSEVGVVTAGMTPAHPLTGDLDHVIARLTALGLTEHSTQSRASHIVMVE